MNKCPLSYEQCSGLYSEAGLHKLSPRLQRLALLPFDAEGLRYEATLRADKMSVQGVQVKLSARLEPSKEQFSIVDTNGRFILKPQTIWPELPQNEDLTMHLAAACGIEVPLHGLIYANDKSFVYFIKRFDRIGASGKVLLEDFAQLTGQTRETKYDFSMERLVRVLDQHCTFPMIEKQKLFQRTIFNFLVGNEDMHLKNFSLITKKDIVELAPAYDFLSSTLVLRDAEEIALPLNGKKKNLTRRMLVDYWGNERLGLTAAATDDVLQKIFNSFGAWDDWIRKSFLTPRLRESYLELVAARREILEM